jgi:hypothetical protein
MKSQKFYFRSRISIITILSFLYSILVGLGIYGFGSDYYESYLKPNQIYDDFWDKYGWYVVTFSILDINLGVYITSFILSFSSGVLIDFFFKSKKINSSILFVVIFFITVHTWPIIMSTSNAMRQGLTMSFIFLSLVALANKNLKLFLLFLLFQTFAHTSGLLFFYIFVITLIFKKIIKFLNINLIIFLSLINFFISYLLILLIKNYDENSSAIENDFTNLFLVLNIFFIIFFSYNKKYLNSNYFTLFSFIFSSTAIAVLLMGQNWQYERLNMMMLVPYIFCIGQIFEKKLCTSLWIYLLFFLIILTITTGVYDSLK